MVDQLLDDGLLRLWKTGADRLVHTPEEDEEHADVSITPNNKDTGSTNNDVYSIYANAAPSSTSCWSMVVM